MKKIIIYILAIVFALCSSIIAEARTVKKTEAVNNTIVVKKGDKLSDEEMARIAKRVEEIRDMDRSNMTAKERKELREELSEYREHYHGGFHGGVYIGGGTLFLIILLIILLA